MSVIETFFHIPYQWTFECNQILFQLYTWITFAIPSMLCYLTYMGLVIADPNGKDAEATAMKWKMLIVLLILIAQFFTVLGIGNLIYYGKI